MAKPAGVLRGFPGYTARRTPKLTSRIDTFTLCVYTPRMKSPQTKLFQTSGSLAVRLPKKCTFHSDSEVIVRQEGRRVIIEAKDEWSSAFRACLGAWKADIPRPKQKQLRSERNPFA